MAMDGDSPDGRSTTGVAAEDTLLPPNMSVQMNTSF